ncbi:MAG: glutathione S-transferase C-terminal domain-containing protein [Pseudomonadota bacterium]
MGRMIDGVWMTDEGIAAAPSGEWTRAPSVLRDRVGSEAFPAAPGRYHLIAAWNCPWAHRALLGRVVKGLTEAIGASYCAPRRTDQGWVFDWGHPDPLFGAGALHELYSRAVPDYSGRVTVPVLWDLETGRIVSNESADILRMMNDAWGGQGPDLYPAALRGEIDEWSDRIHKGLNNGVYRAGFAETQAAYDAAVLEVFETLDGIEARLGDGRDWLMGDAITETDLRLFPTLARFDVAYHSAFKCDRRRLIDYPRLWTYARRLYALPGVAETVAFDVYRRGYHSPSPKRNPLGIVPIGPDLDWSL